MGVVLMGDASGAFSPTGNRQRPAVTFPAAGPGSGGKLFSLARPYIRRDYNLCNNTSNTNSTASSSSSRFKKLGGGSDGYYGSLVRLRKRDDFLRSSSSPEPELVSHKRLSSKKGNTFVLKSYYNKIYKLK